MQYKIELSQLVEDPERSYPKEVPIFELTGDKGSIVSSCDFIKALLTAEKLKEKNA